MKINLKNKAGISRHIKHYANCGPEDTLAGQLLTCDKPKQSQGTGGNYIGQASTPKASSSSARKSGARHVITKLAGSIMINVANPT